MWELSAWPSQLAVGATWDPELARQYGEALGREFRGKGANVALGPGVNVARVARCGRSAEYLTGEEPSLGAALGAAYVRGLQSMGVAASVKHFVANAQENHRDSIDSIIDERSLREIYYAPFEACVKAGAASVMCSYNLVNGVHACGPSRVLQDLKAELRFSGWVMSDWWAITSDAALPFVDQEMPGTGTYGRPSWYSDEKLLGAAAAPPSGASHKESMLDGMAKRILGGMLRADAFRSPVCSVGCDCAATMYDSKPPPANHTALSRRVAAASVVLLKNDKSALPLRLPKDGSKLRVALVGSACSTPRHIDVGGDWRAGSYYVVGGSGRVIPAPDEIISVQTALSHVSGISLEVSATDGVQHALAAASHIDGEGRPIDVIIACAGGTTTESLDRPHLKLDQDGFLRDFTYHIEQRHLSAAQHLPFRKVPLIVLTMAPGSFLTEEWGPRADAIATLFLGGAQSGHAFADVLTGAVNPSGRLPLTMPMSEHDLIPPCEVGAPCYHSEGLFIGWRALVNRSVAYPFGHGLSYTQFGYSFADEPSAVAEGAGDADSTALRVRVTVANEGTVAGRSSSSSISRTRQRRWSRRSSYARSSRRGCCSRARAAQSPLRSAEETSPFGMRH